MTFNQFYSIAAEEVSKVLVKSDSIGHITECGLEILKILPRYVLRHIKTLCLEQRCVSDMFFPQKTYNYHIKIRKMAPTPSPLLKFQNL